MSYTGQVGRFSITVLTGQDLIDFVNANEDLPTPELVREAGYTRVTKKGKTQLLTKPFYNALLKARGVELKQPKASGKLPSFETSVHTSGIVLVGKTYTERFGLEEGDVLKIELGEGEIRLIPQIGRKAEPKKAKPAAEEGAAEDPACEMEAPSTNGKKSKKAAPELVAA